MQEIGDATNLKLGTLSHDIVGGGGDQGIVGVVIGGVGVGDGGGDT